MAVTINIPSQVKTYANLAAFPASGSLKTIYIAEDTNKTYRWDGSTYVEISASAATGLTVGTTPIASGTIGRVLFQGTGNVLQQSSSLFWDSTNNRLGIGTETPAFTFQTYRNTSAGYLASFNSGATLNTNASLTIRIENANLPSLQALNAGAGGFNTFALNPLGGNILIGTTTDAGFRLDVNGTARVSGASYFGTASGNVGVGTTDASTPFSTAKGVVINAGVGNDVQLRMQNFATGNTPNDGGLLSISNTLMYLWNYEAGPLILGANNAERMRIFSTGNVGINTTTDAGFRLDVNGTARVQGNITQSGANTAALGYITNGTLGVYSNAPATGLVGVLVGCVSNNGHTAIFTKGNSPNSTAIRITDQNVGASVNHLMVDYLGATGFGIANGTLQVNASAQVEIQSTTKGFLPPRMTTTQKNAIASPATGLQVYDTTLNQMSYYNGTTWTNI